MAKSKSLALTAKVLPFLLKDEVGFYGSPIIHSDGFVVLDLSDGISTKLSTQALPEDLTRFDLGDKWYFTEEGVFVKAVKIPREDKPNTRRGSPLKLKSNW